MFEWPRWIYQYGSATKAKVDTYMICDTEVSLALIFDFALVLVLISATEQSKR